MSTIPLKYLRRLLGFLLCLWITLTLAQTFFQFDHYMPSRLSPEAGTSLDSDDHAEPHFNEFLQLSSNQASNYTIILYWTKYFNEYSVENFKNENYLRARLRFQQILKRPMHCYDRYPECLVTNDRAYLSKAGALIFHWNNVDGHDLPPKLDPSTRAQQLWALYNLEAPPLSYRLDESEDYYFNLMVNYRHDADVHLPYARTVKRDIPLVDNSSTSLNLPEWSAKRKPIAWMVSNCRTQSRREDYVAQLGKLIDVDIYGQCGSLSCSRRQMNSCYRNMARDYYFYLSFENAFCKDYVTEKVFNILEHGLVPVVYGGAHYQHILPPGSYIDAGKLKPSQLATLLRAIMADRARYESFFAWRQFYRIEKPGDLNEHLYCRLCQLLANGATQKLENRWSPKRVNEYYFGNASCWEPNLENEP